MRGKLEGRGGSIFYFYRPAFVKNFGGLFEQGYGGQPTLLLSKYFFNLNPSIKKLACQP
jgi:hypothetical protein